MSEAGSDPYLQKDVSAKLRQPDEDKEQFFFKKPRSKPSLQELIKEILKTLGAAKPAEIATHLKEKHKNRVEEGAQIAPILSGSPEFLQVAPTVYALRKSDSGTDCRIEQNERGIKS